MNASSRVRGMGLGSGLFEACQGEGRNGERHVSRGDAEEAASGDQVERNQAELRAGDACTQASPSRQNHDPDADLDDAGCAHEHRVAHGRSALASGLTYCSQSVSRLTNLSSLQPRGSTRR